MRGVCFIFAAVFAAPLAAADETAPPSANAPLREKWQGVYAEIARSLEFRAGKTHLALHDQPLLHYTNPVRATDQHGTLFLWTDRGRPAAIGSIWSAENRTDRSLRNITHEFHSLSEEPDLVAARDAVTLWTAGEPGIAWRTLADVPEPAASRAARLVQMRAIGRRLVATIVAEEPSELRLMPQPIFRYGEKTTGAADGAIFAFVLATDPELFLLLEASDGDKPAYRAAFARFGNLAMTVEDGEQKVWSCERGTPGRSDGKYYLHWRAEQRKADLSP